MRKTLLAVSVSLALALCAPTAIAGDAPPLTLIVEPGSDVAADEIAREIGAELGRPVHVARTGDYVEGDVLSVRSQGGVISARYADGNGHVVARELTAPSEGSARVRTIALLAGNLARNQVDDIIGKNPDAAPADGRTEFVIRAAPGDRVTAEVQPGGSTAAAAPSPAAPPAPLLSPTKHDVPAVEETGTVQRVSGWVLFGAGVAAGAGGFIFRAQPGAAESCEANVCAAQVDGAQRNQVIGNLMIAGGALAAVTGLVVVLSAPHASRVSTALAVGPGEVSFLGRF
jgi:hypothetical protein